ncbi:MAG: YeeE/YedE thiosulfate transporter family protein [Candidatus Binatia bacterium]
MTPVSLSFGSFLYDQYDKAFGRPWPVMPSALVIAALSVFLFAFDRPWTASDGLRSWGDWLFQSLGFTFQADLLPPHLYSGSVLNLGLLAGGLATALLSREFAVRGAPLSEMIKGALGGLLMGCGAMLAFGCNIGGFFSALSALSASGAGMMAGLLIGALIGTRYVIWENAKLIEAGQLPFPSACEAAPRPASAAAAFRLQPLAGVCMLVAVLALGIFYHQFGHARLAVFLYFGVAFGVVFQRSRFCLVNAFREPFLSGNSEHARAAALALILGMIGFTILKGTDLKDASEWVFPSFWLGALFGGVLFGLGMVLAGGCGAGSIWRAGEGHVKLWVAVFFFAASASIMRQLLVRTDLIRRLGDGVFLPNVLGWTGAVWGVAGLMIIWYLLTGWNEEKKRAHVLQF